MAYATPDELAAEMRIRVTPANTQALADCLDAAAREIDDAVDRADPITAAQDLALAKRVNLLRGEQWFKANDAAFGAVGMDTTGVLQAPSSSFARLAATLQPLKQGFGVA